MTNLYKINVDGIGPIFFKHSRLAKHVIISVKPFKGVRVAVPFMVPFKKAEDFVFLKTEWIKKHLEKMKQYEKEGGSVQFNFNDIGRATAKKMLTHRLKQLAEKHGFTYNKVSIRSQRTRWGSCSYKNNISLNMKLVKLPQELMDYVILHELVHTKIHNHSKKFWVELDNYVLNARSKAKRLRTNGLELV
ncbi:M48 family metallopeptidase [Chloroflexota bacterium]